MQPATAIFPRNALRRIARFVLTLSASLIVFVNCASAEDWTLVPGKRFGPITRDMGEREIIKVLGEQHVTRSEFPWAEGSTFPATTLFAEDPTKRAFVLWHDPETRRSISHIFVRDERTKWRTDRGITIGTSLQALEKLNGKPFYLAGFAWDYGGTVIESNGGRLTELGVNSNSGLQNRTLLLRVEPGSELQRTRAYGSVTGDKRFSSGHPAMQELNPRVYEMIFEFSEM